MSLAAINSPKTTTLSGDPEILEEISQSLDQEAIFTRFLNVEVPYHSPKMDTIHEELVNSLEDLQPQAASIPLVSTASGALIEGPELDADYWWRNVRYPVLFAEAMEKLIDSECNTFLEVSAHPVLAPSMMECLGASSDATVIHSLRQQEPDCATMLGNLGRLYTKGFHAHWSRLYPNPSSPIKLPRYPWQHEHYWGESAESQRSRQGTEWHPLLGEPMATARRTWSVTLDARTPPYLSDHRVQGAVVYPAAAFVEMGLSAARAGLGEGPIVLEEVEILKALVLNDRAASEMQLTLDDDATSFDIRSRSCAADSSWALNVSGLMRLNSYSPEPNPIDLQALLDRCPTEFSVFVTV